MQAIRNSSPINKMSGQNCKLISSLAEFQTTIPVIKQSAMQTPLKIAEPDTVNQGNRLSLQKI